MPTRIDHVIAAADDFSALEAAFTRLGFHLTGGGTHPHLGTRNRIIVLGDGYLELLGIADADRVSPVISRRLASGGAGWVGFALQSGDIAAEAESMRSRGVDARGPYPGRLVAPNGMARSWRVLLHGSDDLWASAESLPFLIQHDSAGEAHRLELAGEGTLAPHANGALRLHVVTIATSSHSGSLRQFAQTYDLQPSGATYRSPSLGADVVSLPLSQESEVIELAAPTGPGIAQERITSTGEGACAVSVAVASLDETASLLRGRGITYSLTDDALWTAPPDFPAISLCFVPARG